MSEPRSNSPQDGGDSGQSSAAAHDEKPRLTEEEKKQNHIASGNLLSQLIQWHCLLPPGEITNTLIVAAEQKRREAIRAGFDRLCELVPGLEGHGRSEGFVLKETVKYMREQLAKRRELIEAKEARGQPIKILERLEERDRQRALDGGHDPDDNED
ncbi:Transcription factor [Parahypoxylon ruwenzoriense]